MLIILYVKRIVKTPRWAKLIIQRVSSRMSCCSSQIKIEMLKWTLLDPDSHLLADLIAVNPSTTFADTDGAPTFLVGCQACGGAAGIQDLRDVDLVNAPPKRCDEADVAD